MRNERRKKFILSIGCMLVLMASAFEVHAGPIGFNGTPMRNSSMGQPVQTPQFPFVYNPNRDLYEWKIKDYPDYQECYYDPYVGQYIGTCNLSLDSPGYSVTFPNRVPQGN